MDVLSEQTIDIGLKVIGYLAAAGLGMLIHAAIAGRRRSVSAATEARIEVLESQNTANRNHADVQFVDLRGSRSDANAHRTASSRGSSKLTADARRDRPEIIRLARQMLKAGTPAEMVRRTLPISDAELAFLQSANAR